MSGLADALRVAEADKSRPLPARGGNLGFTCALCGARQEPGAWRVTLPDRLGLVCTGCAGDAGWRIQ